MNFKKNAQYWIIAMKPSHFFLELARSGHVWEILTKSFCPEIKEYTATKQIIILSLVGVETKKNRANQIYLLGDAPHITTPLLQACTNLIQKTLYVRENFSTEIVQKLSTGHYNCLIMDNLEQVPEKLLDQILTTIQALNLTSILASAPTYKHYDQYRCPSENIPMPDYLMPLMDFIFIIRDLEYFDEHDAAIDLSELINNSNVNSESNNEQELDQDRGEIRREESAENIEISENRSERAPTPLPDQKPLQAYLKENKTILGTKQQHKAFWNAKTQRLIFNGLKKYIECAQSITVHDPCSEIEEYINRWIRNLKKYLNYRLPSNFIANLVYYAGNLAKLHFRNNISKADIKTLIQISFGTSFFHDLLKEETDDPDLEENPFDNTDECVNSHFFNEDVPD